MPNSPRHYRSNRGRMGGNMMPLPHAVHTMNYMTHPQPAKEFMSLPRQVLFSTLSCSINDVNIGKYIHLLHGLLCDLCLHIKHFHQICPQCVCVCVLRWRLWIWQLYSWFRYCESYLFFVYILFTRQPYTLELLQRFNHPKYFSNDVMANSLPIHQSDPVSTMNDSFSNYLASAPPAEQKNLLGNRLYPLVERHQVVLFLPLVTIGIT